MFAAERVKIERMSDGHTYKLKENGSRLRVLLSERQGTALTVISMERGICLLEPQGPV